MRAKKALEGARQAEHQGKAPSTQAAEFVREEIEHIREGKHGARSWPEWHEDKAYLEVILRMISVWCGVHFDDGVWVKEAADTLQKTLNEEEEADKKLTSITESQVNVYAASRGR